MALKVVKMLKMLRFKSMPRMHLILKMLEIPSTLKILSIFALVADL